MAAQARLFYPVRCAAISLGPPSPAYPKPLYCPNSLCRQSVILQNEPNFANNQNEPNPLLGNDLRRNIPSPTTRKTNPNEPNFRAWPPANHRPRTPESRATSHGSRATGHESRASILQNEPNPRFRNDLRKITPVNSVSLAYNSAPIREYKRYFRAISRVIRDNSRQLALIRDKTFCGFVLPRLDAESRRVAKNLCGL
jgi:hypothetical protein